MESTPIRVRPLFSASGVRRTLSRTDGVRMTSAAFGLVECLGVLSILTILASIAAGPVLTRLRGADQAAEAIAMSSLRTAFEKVVLERRLLPGTNDWVTLLAPELDRPAQSIFASKSGCPRLLIYRPGSLIQPGATSEVQTASGFAASTNGTDRVLLVGTLLGRFPTNFNPTSAGVFDSLWNTPPHQRPAGWSAADLSDPEDLQIARVDLRELMHRVTLNNLSQSNAPLRLSVADDGNILVVQKQNPSQAWQRSFIHGTTLNLHDPVAAIARQEVITDDRTLYFGDDGWGDASLQNKSISPQVAQYVHDFLNASFPDAENEQRPRAAIDELYRALWSYMDWSEGGFVEGGNNKKQAPDAYVVRSTVARLNQGTLNLIGSGGGHGGGGGCGH